MAAPTRRKWYATALILAFVAISSQLAAKNYAGLGMSTMARSDVALHYARRYTDTGIPMLAEGEAAAAKQLSQAAFRYAHCSDLLGGLSLILVLLTVACWAAARRFGERGPRVLLIVLLSIYLLLLLLVV
jgi:hypothetical protein